MKCHHCKADTTNGLALCELCQMAASQCLEYLQTHCHNLNRYRPESVHRRTVPDSRPPCDATIRPDEESDRVRRELGRVENDLIGWARCLEDDRGVPVPTVADDPIAVVAICRSLAEHITSIATLEWCGDFVGKLVRHERRLGTVAQQVAPGWYAGRCQTCATPTHVLPGLTWVTCKGCGVVTYARDHLPVILAEAGNTLLTSEAIAGLLVAMIQGERDVSALRARIRKWDSLGWLTGHRATDRDGDPTGPKRYRLSEVLDLVQGNSSAPTRPKRTTSV